jgi:DNA-binding transcriptional ArsR family regulator/Txe/YoeB family toxin of Txe-Axe toxin-antitoxin module
LNNVTLTKHVDYIAEATHILEAVAQKKSIKKLKETYISKYNISFQSAIAFFDTVDKIITDTNGLLSKEQPQISFYFSPVGGNSFTLANLVLLISQDDINETAASIFDYSIKLSQEEINQRFSDILLNNIESGLTNPSFKDVITLIEGTEASIEEKWNKQQMYINRQKHLPKVVELLKKSERVLSKYYKQLEPCIEEYYEFWSRRLAEANIFEDLYNAFQLSIISENPKGTMIIPNIINFSQITFHSSYVAGTEAYVYDHIRMAILIGDKLSMNAIASSNIYGDYALKCLKLISDKSKLDILTMIKDNKTYGAELARKLNLTTATISHHMSSLMDCRLVTVETDNKRIYYSTNKETISALLDYLKNLLVN